MKSYKWGLPAVEKAWKLQLFQRFAELPQANENLENYREIWLKGSRVPRTCALLRLRICQETFLQRNWKKNLGLVPPSTMKWYKLHCVFHPFLRVGQFKAKEQLQNCGEIHWKEATWHQIPQETLADERNWACSPCEIIKVEPSCSERGMKIERWKERKTFWSWVLEGKDALGSECFEIWKEREREKERESESESASTQTVGSPLCVSMHSDMFWCYFSHNQMACFEHVRYSEFENTICFL